MTPARRLGLLVAATLVSYPVGLAIGHRWLLPALNTLPAYLTMQKACFLFGGLLAPVTLYPAWLAGPALWTPFAAHLYWPASLALLPPGGVATMLGPALLAQGAWLLLLGATVAGMWRVGLRRVLREGA